MADENKLGEAYVEITARFDKFQRDLNEVKRNTERTAQAAQASFAKITTGINGLSSAYRTLRHSAIAAAVGGVVAFVKSTVDAADKLEKMSQKVGIGVEQLQLLQFAARQTGSSTDAMNQSLLIFSRTLGDAQAKAGPAREAFNRLGVDYKQNLGGAFNDVRDKLSRVTDASERNSIASDLFSRSYTEILGVLTLTAGAYANIADKARQFGIVMSDEVVKKAADTANKLNDLQEVLGVVARQAAIEAAPALAKLADFVLKPETLASIHDLSGLIEHLTELAITGAPKMEAFFKSFVFDAGPALTNLANIATALDKIRTHSPDAGSAVADAVASAATGVSPDALKARQLQTQIDNLQLQIEAGQRLLSGESFADRLEKWWNPAKIDALTQHLSDLMQQQNDLLDQLNALKEKAVVPSTHVEPTAPHNPRGSLPDAPFTPAPAVDKDALAAQKKALDEAKSAAELYASTISQINIEIEKLGGKSTIAEELDKRFQEFAKTAGVTDEQLLQVKAGLEGIAEASKAKGLEDAEKEIKSIQDEAAAISAGTDAVHAFTEAKKLNKDIEAFKKDETDLGVIGPTLDDLVIKYRAAAEARSAATSAEGLKNGQKEIASLQDETSAIEEGTKALADYKELKQLNEDVEGFKKDQIEAGVLGEQLDHIVARYREVDKARLDANRGLEEQKAKTKETDKLAKKLGQSFESAFENAVIKGDSLSEVLRGLVEDIERLILKMAVTIPLENAIAGGFSGLFGLFGPQGYHPSPAVQATNLALTGLFHKGGVIGQSGTRRAVNPGLFVGAPRMHAGGMIGLRPGEVPIIGQKGEMVLPKGTKMGGSVSQSIVVNVNANGGDTVQNKALAEQTAKAVKRAVRGEMGAYIRQQQRPGGQLNPT